MVHCRRRFYELHQATGSLLAEEALRRIGELYADRGGGPRPPCRGAACGPAGAQPADRGRPARPGSRSSWGGSRASPTWPRRSATPCATGRGWCCSSRTAGSSWTRTPSSGRSGRSPWGARMSCSPVRTAGPATGRSWLNGVEPLAWLTDVLERMVSGRTKAHGQQPHLRLRLDRRARDPGQRRPGRLVLAGSGEDLQAARAPAYSRTRTAPWPWSRPREGTSPTAGPPARARTCTAGRASTRWRRSRGGTSSCRRPRRALWGAAELAGVPRRRLDEPGSSCSGCGSAPASASGCARGGGSTRRTSRATCGGAGRRGGGGPGGVLDPRPPAGGGVADRARASSDRRRRGRVLRPRAARDARRRGLQGPADLLRPGRLRVPAPSPRTRPGGDLRARGSATTPRSRTRARPSWRGTRSSSRASRGRGSWPCSASRAGGAGGPAPAFGPGLRHRALPSAARRADAALGRRIIGQVAERRGRTAPRSATWRARTPASSLSTESRGLAWAASCRQAGRLGPRWPRRG